MIVIGLMPTPSIIKPAKYSHSTVNVLLVRGVGSDGDCGMQSGGGGAV